MYKDCDNQNTSKIIFFDYLSPLTLRGESEKFFIENENY